MRESYATMLAALTSIMADVGNRIRSARSARKMSQTELARRAAISRQALSAIESGVYQPSVSVALKLARELGDTVESLFAELPFERIDAAVAPGAESAAGTRVALGRVRGRIVAVPYFAAPRALAPQRGSLQSDPAGHERRHQQLVPRLGAPAPLRS